VRLFGALALVVLVAGCGAPTVSLAHGPRPYTESDYDDVYDRWTREDESFSWAEMSDVLRVSATFESWEFRWAYVVRYCHDHSMDVTERDAMLRTTLSDSEQNHRFVVSMQGERFRESDITGRLSAWRVILVDDSGRQATPVEVQRLRRPTAAQLVYFPHINPQRVAFRIAFPTTREDGSPTIPPGSESVRLRFAGPRGRVDLVWKLRDVPDTSGGEAALPTSAPAAATSGSAPETAPAPVEPPATATPASPAPAPTNSAPLEVTPADARGL